MTRRIVSGVVWVVLAGVAATSILWMATAGRQRPLAERDWAADHARAARADIGPDSVTVHDVRDFDWSSGEGAAEGYRTETYHMADVRAVWFALAPFAERWRGLAHSFISFEFADDRYLAVSVEARREVDEPYSLVRGFWRGFETTYVVGTERDVIGQRAVRGDTLFLYPSRATPEQARSVFVDVMARANALSASPEWYNTVLNNCTTNLRDHVNRVASNPLPWGWGIILPGYSDALALRHGILDTELTIEAARDRFRVDALARAALGSGDDFGRRIRVEMPGRQGN